MDHSAGAPHDVRAHAAPPADRHFPPPEGGSRPALRRRRVGLSAGPVGKHQFEHGLARAAGGRHGAAVQPHDAVDDGQPQPGGARRVAARRVAPVEAAEHVRQGLRRDARAAVGHADAGRPSALATRCRPGCRPASGARHSRPGWSRPAATASGRHARYRCRPAPAPVAFGGHRLEVVHHLLHFRAGVERAQVQRDLRMVGASGTACSRSCARGAHTPPGSTRAASRIPAAHAAAPA